MSATDRLSDTAGRQGDDPESAAAPPLTEDEIFHLLQSQRRRAVLRYLQDVDGQVEMRTIAEQVAAWENDTTVQALGSDERQRVYIPLYQSHLPKLDEEGVINYDQDRGIVETTPLVDQLGRYLNGVTPDDVDDEHSLRWDAYYFGAAGFGTVLFLGATLELPLFSLLPGVAVVTIVLASLWTVTLSHSLSG